MNKYGIIAALVSLSWACTNVDSNYTAVATDTITHNHSDHTFISTTTAVPDRIDSIQIDHPHATLQRIFDDYIQYEESTTAIYNLDSIEKSLRIFEQHPPADSTLTLLINYWMYFTITDDDTPSKIEKVLQIHRDVSISMVKMRIQHKKEWESEDSAPYSDLPKLLENLQTKKQ